MPQDADSAKIAAEALSALGATNNDSATVVTSREYLGVRLSRADFGECFLPLCNGKCWE
jgi:hypothetical protein